MNVYLASAAVKLNLLIFTAHRHANPAHCTNMLGHTVRCWLTPTWKIYTDKMCVNNALMLD